MLARYGLAALWAASAVAFANGETLHVRPSADCANNGDGTAYACASGAGMEGAWNVTSLNSGTYLAASDTAGKVDPGDTLCIHGSPATIFYGAASQLGSGVRGLPVSIRFDCEEEAGHLLPTTANNYAFYSEQQWLDVYEPTATCPLDGPLNLGTAFYFPYGSQNPNRFINVYGGHITDCDVKTGESGIHIDGNNALVDGAFCERMERYCVLTNGRSITVRNAIALDNEGTCFVMDGITDNAFYQNLHCVKTGASGSCVEVNDQVGATVIPRVHGLYCEDQNVASMGGGMIIKGAVDVLGVILFGSSTGFSMDGSGGANPGPVTLSGIKSYGASNRHVLVGTNFQPTIIQYSTFVGGGDGVNSSDDGADVVYRYNIFQDLVIGLDEQTVGSANVNHDNVFYNNGTDRRVNFVAGMIDASSITDDPLLDGSYDIGSGSPAWGAGSYAYPWSGHQGACVGSIVNIGATCAQWVNYGRAVRGARNPNRY